jgi:hypothetical protein
MRWVSSPGSQVFEGSSPGRTDFVSHPDQSDSAIPVYRPTFLHDGRDKMLRDAILAHEGQGRTSRDRS